MYAMRPIYRITGIRKRGATRRFTRYLATIQGSEYLAMLQGSDFLAMVIEEAG